MPWLMKAEPDSRVVKGKDVKFSVDDFEAIGTSPWDGVRSHEAKKIMKEKMKLGDEVLFYHSNCKLPGVFALAEIAKEGYPDYTAWDESHPYFDAKTTKEEPTWYMVDVKFKRRLEHPPTLALIKYLVSLSAIPEQVAYIGAGGFKALKEMALVNRGRLSVQPVTPEAFEAVVQLGTKGGWEELLPSGKKGKGATARDDEATTKTTKTTKTESGEGGKRTPNGVKRKPKEATKAAEDSSGLSEPEEEAKPAITKAHDAPSQPEVRRSKRTKR